jgi:mRNA interferase RelE/StbE
MKLTWTVEWDDRARKELRKLDKKLQKDIFRYLRERITSNLDPRRFGKPLSYDKHGLWCYRVQNARIICRIEENELIILVIKIAHRKKVYD